MENGIATQQPYDVQARLAVIAQENAVKALQAQLDAALAENAILRARRKRGLSLGVSEKGCVSVYGLRKFPVTLYKEEWKRIIAIASDIEAFITENDANLK